MHAHMPSPMYHKYRIITLVHCHMSHGIFATSEVLLCSHECQASYLLFCSIDLPSAGHRSLILHEDEMSHGVDYTLVSDILISIKAYSTSNVIAYLKLASTSAALPQTLDHWAMKLG